MEGVMMKNKDVYAVAVRKPDNEIVVEVNTHKDFSDKVRLFKLPIFRGMLAFVDSLVIGIKVLNFSASFFEEEDEKTQGKEKQKKKASKAVDEDFIVEEVSISDKKASRKKAAGDKKAAKKQDRKSEESGVNALLMAVAVLISILMSVGLFMVLPVLITGLFSKITDNRYLIAFLEGVVRLAIFIGYILLASRMKEIKRVFMYHGAEHKTINCLENGFELTVENVRWQTKQHKRCGTSFMLLVVLISLVFFMIIPSGGLLWRVLSRIILVPFIAGISYEFIRIAGKSESKVVQIISQPGLWMQGLTTKEPDDSMIEVAIASVNAVFDWRAFLGLPAAEETEEKAAEAENKTAKTKKAQGKTNKGSQSNKGARANKGAQATKSEQPNQGAQSNKARQSGKSPASPKALPPSGAEEVSATMEQDEPALSVKPQVGGLAYTGKVADTEEMRANLTGKGQIGRNKGAAPISLKPNLSASVEDEEDDDILKALDKYFDDGSKD